jgi:hypothetical protein
MGNKALEISNNLNSPVNIRFGSEELFIEHCRLVQTMASTSAQQSYNYQAQQFQAPVYGQGYNQALVPGQGYSQVPQQLYAQVPQQVDYYNQDHLYYGHSYHGQPHRGTQLGTTYDPVITQQQWPTGPATLETVSAARTAPDTASSEMTSDRYVVFYGSALGESTIFSAMEEMMKDFDDVSNPDMYRFGLVKGELGGKIDPKKRTAQLLLAEFVSEKYAEEAVKRLHNAKPQALKRVGMFAKFASSSEGDRPSHYDIFRQRQNSDSLNPDQYSFGPIQRQRLPPIIAQGTFKRAKNHSSGARIIAATPQQPLKPGEQREQRSTSNESTKRKQDGSSDGRSRSHRSN